MDAEINAESSQLTGQNVNVVQIKNHLVSLNISDKM